MTDTRRHLTARRHPDASAGGNMESPYFIHTTQAAERDLFDMAFLAGGAGVRIDIGLYSAPHRLPETVQSEPLTLLSALAMVGRRAGRIATASTTRMHIRRPIPQETEIPAQ